MLDDDVWRYSPLGAVPTAIVGLLVLGLMLYAARGRSTGAWRAAWLVLLIAVLGIIALTTRGAFSNADGGFDWHLGRSIRGELHNINRELGVVNVLGNVAMFVPLGWAATLVSRRQVIAGVALALALSALVEVGQVLAGSSGDVDDLVLNTAGGLLGALGAKVLRRAPAHASRSTRAIS